jgi:Zn-dependent protease with chaperone function
LLVVIMDTVHILTNALVLYLLRTAAQRQKKEYSQRLETLADEHAAELAGARKEARAAARGLEAARAELSDRAAQHEAEMQLVDAKIRKALSAKDEVVTELAAKLRAAERKVRSAEALIEELNAGISEIA